MTNEKTAQEVVEQFAEVVEKQAKVKAFRTLTEILNAPAGESLETIARISVPLERIISGSGVLKLVFRAEVARGEVEGAELGAQVVAAILSCFGDYMPEVKEILAAINGCTVAELEQNYTGLDIIRMFKALVGDEGFLSSVLTLAE